jgi:hypothetical protein
MRNGPRWLAFFRLRNVQTPARIGKRESLLSIGSSFPFAQNTFPKSWRIRSPKNCRRRGSSESTCPGHRLSQVQDRANSQASRKRKTAAPGVSKSTESQKSNTELRFSNSITMHMPCFSEVARSPLPRTAKHGRQTHRHSGHLIVCSSEQANRKRRFIFSGRRERER